MTGLVPWRRSLLSYREALLYLCKSTHCARVTTITQCTMFYPHQSKRAWLSRVIRFLLQQHWSRQHILTMSSQPIKEPKDEKGVISGHVTRMFSSAFLSFHFHLKLYSCSITTVPKELQPTVVVHGLLYFVSSSYSNSRNLLLVRLLSCCAGLFAV